MHEEGDTGVRLCLDWFVRGVEEKCLPLHRQMGVIVEVQSHTGTWREKQTCVE